MIAAWIPPSQVVVQVDAKEVVDRDLTMMTTLPQRPDEKATRNQAAVANHETKCSAATVKDHSIRQEIVS